jgi:hypothetical protein
MDLMPIAALLYRPIGPRPLQYDLDKGSHCEGTCSAAGAACSLMPLSHALVESDSNVSAANTTGHPLFADPG